MGPFVRLNDGSILTVDSTATSFIDSYKSGGVSRIPLENYEANLTHFIKTLQNQKKHVVLIAPNPFGNKFERFHNERLLQYVAVVRMLAKKYETGLVDNFNDFQKYAADTGESVDALLLDGAHPNDKGHKMIADNLVNEITKILARPRG